MIRNIPTTPNRSPEYRMVWAIIVFAVLSSASFLIFKNDFISEPSFVIFILSILFISIVVLCIDKVTSFKFKDFQITLREIKETESNIKELALATVELVESGTDGLMATHLHDSERYERAKQAITGLTKNITS